MRLIERAIWVVAVLWCALVLWPASYWYEAGVLRVDDFREGQTLNLIYTGGAERAFHGSYSVIIRDAGNQSVVSEDRSGKFRYKVGSERPNPLTMEWWAPRDLRGHNLPAGTYVMETCWVIHRPFWGLAPSKVTCAMSNPFRVHPRGEE